MAFGVTQGAGLLVTRPTSYVLLGQLLKVSEPLFLSQKYNSVKSNT